MTTAADKLSAEDLVAFEAEVAEVFNSGRVRGPVHLNDGNEEQLLGIFRVWIREGDWVLSSWRSHYHCLLKGVPRDVLMREITAGRSIALNFPEHRVISSAMVGGTLPIAVGIGWAIKWGDWDEQVWCFVGDMTAETGIAHECMKYCANHQLPVNFVVEDNGISVCTPTGEVWGVWDGRWQYVRRYQYRSKYPHAGAGVRVQF